jgi:hypothetical protein
MATVCSSLRAELVHRRSTEKRVETLIRDHKKTAVNHLENEAILAINCWRLPCQN